ncbi:GTPase [Flagelloscypha sp. PMI_526]|nr:GTPase [Flagelloscypha sp. PMI_526]
MQRSCHFRVALRRTLFREFQSAASSPAAAIDASEDLEVLRRRRKSEWKRRQKGETFLDYTVVTIRAGKGGDGCAAFHREKWKPFGPPSGGNGGRGGDVYIKPVKGLTTLSAVPKRVVAEQGANGQGSWLNGRNAEPTIIRVPLGTIVREIARGDPRRAKDEWEAEEESMSDYTPDQKRHLMRERRWVHYPGADEDNIQRDAFIDAEKMAYNAERQRRVDRFTRSFRDPIALDLDQEIDSHITDDSPLGTGKRQNLGHLLASGGAGGLGNPHFLSGDNRSPNTLLRAVTGGRANAEVAGYAFTTLNPTVGVVRVADDGSFAGSLREDAVYDETEVEEEERLARMRRGDFAFSATRNQAAGEITSTYFSDIKETFRFTVADNPGLVEHASENVGLGHSFLRSIERSLALAYVVDLSGPDPCNEVSVLRDELEAYLPGLSRRARLVIANKADLLGGNGSPEDVEAAKEKLAQLENFVASELGKGDEDAPKVEVVPVSAKFNQNVQRVVGLMKKYVEEARKEAKSLRN